jgi:hypothetical protein
MSKDFPNRTEWLARRTTPAKLPAGRYVHVSAPLVTIMDNGSPRTIVGRGTTLNVGSKQRKAKAFAAKQARKAERRAAKRVGLIEQRYEAHLTACRDFDAEKIAQEAEAA